MRPPLPLQAEATSALSPQSEHRPHRRFWRLDTLSFDRPPILRFSSRAGGSATPTRTPPTTGSRPGPAVIHTGGRGIGGGRAIATVMVGAAAVTTLGAAAITTLGHATIRRSMLYHSTS